MILYGTDKKEPLELKIGSKEVVSVFIGMDGEVKPVWNGGGLVLYNRGVTNYGVSAGDMADPTYNSMPYTVNSDSIVFENTDRLYNRWTSFVKTAGKIDLTPYTHVNVLCDIIIEGTYKQNNLVGGASGVGLALTTNVYNYSTDESNFDYFKSNAGQNRSLITPSDLTGGFDVNSYYKSMNETNYVLKWDVSKVNKAVQIWLCPYALNHDRTPKDQHVYFKLKKLYLT